MAGCNRIRASSPLLKEHCLAFKLYTSKSVNPRFMAAHEILTLSLSYILVMCLCDNLRIQGAQFINYVKLSMSSQIVRIFIMKPTILDVQSFIFSVTFSLPHYSKIPKVYC